MTLFSGPEYASYIALCRELRLEREFEPGDWIARTGFKHIDGALVTVLGGHNLEPGVTWKASDLDIWLPRLDQWMAMLEEAGADCPEFDRETTTGHYVLRRGMPDEWGHSQYGTGPTREEAAARLWMAVTGREVPA